MEPGKALLVSIRPRYVEQIFAGTKTVELRRVRPRVEAGALVIVYASGTQKALVGAFQIAEVTAASPAAIWQRFGSKTGLNQAEFDSYFTGVETGFAIEVAQTWKLAEPVQLSTLRRQHGGFHAPQGYRYLDMGEVLSMGGEALLGRRQLSPVTSKCTTSGHQKVYHLIRG
jgi:predicted transcriptional regulator